MQPQSPWDSPRVRGKIYVIEYDLRTYLDPPPGNTPASYDFLQTKKETSDLLLHDFTSAAIRGHGLYVLDPKVSCFYNATANGTVAIWNAVRLAVRAASHFKRSSDASSLAAEVAVFVDDISTAHWPLEISRGALSEAGTAGIPGWPYLNLGNVPATWGAMPFPVRYHLLSDLLSPQFTAARIKLAVLLNPIRINDSLAAAIRRKLQGQGKTVVYSVGVAVVDGAGRSTPNGGRELTGLSGLTLGNLSEPAPTRQTVFARPGNDSGWSAAAQAAWAPLVGKTAGASWAASPYWWYNHSNASLPGEKVVVLGHFAGTEQPSLVWSTSAGGHTVVFSANPALPATCYLSMAMAAGVHVYTPVVSSTTRVEAGGNMLVVPTPRNNRVASTNPLHVLAQWFILIVSRSRYTMR